MSPPDLTPDISFSLMVNRYAFKVSLPFDACLRGGFNVKSFLRLKLAALSVLGIAVPIIPGIAVLSTLRGRFAGPLPACLRFQGIGLTDLGTYRIAGRRLCGLSAEGRLLRRICAG